MRYIGIVISILITLGIVGCKSDKNTDLVRTELTKYGMPININIPKNAEITDASLGVMKDITIEGDKNYSLQIFSSEATERDAKVVSDKLKAEVKEGPFFSELVKEDAHGFIFKKIIGDRTNYDFRYTLIQGDTEYLFQTALVGTFTQEEVENMYNSVQK